MGAAEKPGRVSVALWFVEVTEAGSERTEQKETDA